MIGESIPLRSRVPRAVFVLVVNLILWVLFPILIGNALSAVSKSIPLTESSFIYAFGATITGLQVLAALTQGMAVSVPFASGSYLASAYFIWAATNGGDIAVLTGGLSVSFSFAPLVYLLMLPLFFSALRAPITFLLEESEVARTVTDMV